MIRWGSLLLGLASIGLGLTGFLMHPPIESEGQSVSPEQALDLIEDQDRVYVEIDAGLDQERILYTALSKRPSCAGHDPADVYAVEPGGVPLEDYLGVRVRLKVPAHAEGIALEAVLESLVARGEGRRERLLSPLGGPWSGVWALSPMFQPHDPERGAWGSAETVEGVVTRMGDIEENTSTYALEWKFAKIRQVAEEELGVRIGGHELLVIEGVDAVPSGAYRMPVLGSGGALVAGPFFTNEARPPWVEAGPVTGLLWGWGSTSRQAQDIEHLRGAIPGANEAGRAGYGRPRMGGMRST